MNPKAMADQRIHRIDAFPALLGMTEIRNLVLAKNPKNQGIRLNNIILETFVGKLMTAIEKEADIITLLSGDTENKI